MITGSNFVSRYAGKGLASWESAAFDIAKQDGLTPWPWVKVSLSDGKNHATIKVQSDVLAIGPASDHVRLPLTPKTAQDIFNLHGWLLPTPWLVYQFWRAAPIKLMPSPSAPNKGADLRQYADHSRLIDQQIKQAGGRLGQLIAGQKKHVVVSNIAAPGKVVIFGWYRPTVDVFDDGTSMSNLDRQPIQPKSNFHGDFYVDYSHGIQAVGPMATVNGRSMPTIELYQHPELSRLVSNEGPMHVPRYPSSIKPAPPVAFGEISTSHVIAAAILLGSVGAVIYAYRKEMGKSKYLRKLRFS